VLKSPEGQEFSNSGSYLEIIENELLVWTNALMPGFRPAPTHKSEGRLEFFFTATIQLETHGPGTRYVVIVRHADEEGCRKQSAMGFQEGWGIALDQFVTYAKNRKDRLNAN
jgi:uncharacterized protein YndB with AHSA1/START domain